MFLIQQEVSFVVLCLSDFEIAHSNCKELIRHPFTLCQNVKAVLIFKFQVSSFYCHIPFYTSIIGL